MVKPGSSLDLLDGAVRRHYCGMPWLGGARGHRLTRSWTAWEAASWGLAATLWTCLILQSLASFKLSRGRLLTPSGRGSKDALVDLQ